jgi:hypothetical protein
MEPWIRSRVHATPLPFVRMDYSIYIFEVRRTCVSRARVTALHTSRRYFSRYFGKRVAKDDSSVNVPPVLSVDWKGSIFH